MRLSMRAADATRNVVKVDASMSRGASASRHRMELAAKHSMAVLVNSSVRRCGLAVLPGSGSCGMAPRGLNATTGLRSPCDRQVGPRHHRHPTKRRNSSSTTTEALGSRGLEGEQCLVRAEDSLAP